MTNTPGLSPEQDDVLQQRLKELEAIEVETATPSTEGEEQPKPTAATPQPSTETEAAAPKEETKEKRKEQTSKTLKLSCQFADSKVISCSIYW